LPDVRECGDFMRVPSVEEYRRSGSGFEHDELFGVRDDVFRLEVIGERLVS
jgi:ssDNA-binding replication factor A large subunit